jgi:hypothetical protein
VINPRVINCGRCGNALGEILDLRGWDFHSEPPPHVNINLFNKVKFPAGPKRDVMICIQPGYVRSMNEDRVMVYSLIKRARDSLRSGLRPAGYRRGNRGRDQAWFPIERLPALIECPCESRNWLRAELFTRIPSHTAWNC